VHRIGIVAAALLVGASLAPNALAGEPSADLALSGQLDLEPVHVGEDHSLVLTVANQGPADAVDVVISVGLAQGPVLVGFGWSQGECLAGADAIDCTIPRLPGGAVALVHVQRYVTGPGTLETPVVVRSATPDPDPSDDALTDTVTVLGAACTQVGAVHEPDRLTGGSGPDVLCGLGGDDVLVGRGGPDHLYGGPSEDQLRGGGDADGLVAGAGTDEAMGEGGADIIDALDGVGGNDHVVGGADDDVCGADPGDVVLSCP
jgi:hypothetical protein